MTRTGFQKSVRMFRKFSEESLRRHGGNSAGRESVAALATLDAVLKAEQLLDASLLEPLSAFTNLLQSSQLPPEFGNYSFADALIAIEEAHAEQRQNDEQHWEFAPELDDESAARWLASAPAPTDAEKPEHDRELERFVLDASSTTARGHWLVVDALSARALPLGELAARAERLTLNDVDLRELEALVRRKVPEALRSKVRLERYDSTGAFAALSRGAQQIIESSSSQSEAENELARFVASYDVGSGSAGISLAEDKPALAISAFVLTRLGQEGARSIALALAKRGWEESATERAPLGAALALFRCLLQHHHIQALRRRAHSAILVSEVSEVELRRGPGGATTPSEPRDLLFVQRLSERLPQATEIKAERSWERQSSAGGRSVVTLIEALAF